MRRFGIAVVVAFVVLAGIAAPAFGVETGATPMESTTATTLGIDTAQTESPSPGANDSADDDGEMTAPGARLAGVVGVQGAEIGGELESRSFQAQVTRAQSNESKAAVVARQTNRSQARLEALRAELQRVEAAHANGSVSTGEYRARTARLTAQIRAVERVTSQTEATAVALPEEVLRERGVDVDRLRALLTDASELSGSEVSAIARDIGGPNVGRGFGPEMSAHNASAERGDDAPGQSGDAPGHTKNDRSERSERVNETNTSTATDSERPSQMGKKPDNARGQGEKQQAKNHPTNSSTSANTAAPRRADGQS